MPETQYRLVPVNPTPEMLRAANNLGDWPAYGDGAGPSEIWAAMLDAAEFPGEAEAIQALQRHVAEMCAKGIIRGVVIPPPKEDGSA